MWKIWKEELHKIASRKIIWLGLFALLAFNSLRLVTELNHYSVMADGHVFYGQEAVDKDKALTAQYAGTLTEEKVRQIYSHFGFYQYDPGKGTGTGNFCSRFITEQMTDYNGDGRSPEEISFLQGEDWEKQAAPLLTGDIRFDYVYGWKDLTELYAFMTIMGLSVILIIGLSPVFAQEYTLRTADILLTTPRGKKSGIWIKMAAALFFTSAIFCSSTLYLWLSYLAVYGTQGLDASPALVGVPMGSYCPDTIGGFFLFLFALGLAGTLLLTGITLAVSALCKNAFLAVIVSLALFFLPYAWMNAISHMLFPILPIGLLRAISHFMISMPYYLPLNWGFSLSARQTALHLAVAAAALGGCAVLGYHRYRNFQR